MVADDVEMGHYETFWDIIQAHNVAKGACHVPPRALPICCLPRTHHGSHGSTTIPVSSST